MSSARSGRTPRAAKSKAGRAASRADREIARSLAAWFSRCARDFPWRDAPPGQRDPYRVLVSELMLQQTQASRVAERYPVFIGRFPDVRSLAEADEQEVLSLWSGLGYYRRAKLLHAAAKAIAGRYGGVPPRDAKELRSIPGVGAYTAGAIASLAFDLPEPAPDGNVTRVVLRLLGEPLSINTPKAQKLAADKARAIIDAGVGNSIGPGVINESLIELGATVCTPRSPSCGNCPLAGLCVARREGLTDTIPAPKKAPQKKTLHALAVLAINERGERLVERRGPTGLWAGLWQAPTVESPEPIDPTAVRPGGVAPGGRIDEFVHETTHRSVRFVVCEPSPGDITPSSSVLWKPLAEIEGLGLSSVQRRILLNTGPKARPEQTAPTEGRGLQRISDRPSRYAVPEP